jgi:predicted MFS family arabinose efflux permease
VFVNTVVIVQSGFGLDAQQTAWALAAFGAGSMVAALTLPPLLERLPDRSVLIAGAAMLVATLLAGRWLVTSYPALLGVWALLGCGYSLTLTPIGRVLRRSSHAEDRPALFAAHFALSHACWLIAYPLAGFVSANFGVDSAFFSLCAFSALGCISALVMWPARDLDEVEHRHDDLPADHPHIAGGLASHSHAFVIDELHRRWPG